jgi:hypothetical protein
VLSFAKQNPVKDLDRRLPEVTTYASGLRKTLEQSLEILTAKSSEMVLPPEPASEETPEPTGPDILALAKRQAFQRLDADEEFKNNLAQGIPWGVVIGKLAQALPESLHNRNEIAAGLVVEAMNTLLGRQKEDWDAQVRQTASGKPVRFIFRLQSS